MKLDIQLFASNTLYVKCNGYTSSTAYNFKINAVPTGNINGNTREVKITYSVYAQQPGGYQSYTSPKAYILVNGSSTSNTTVRNIWPRGTWQTLLEQTLYLQAGTTHKITGRFNSNASTDYLPLNGNRDVNVNITLDATAAILTNVELANDFITSGKFTPTFTDQITTGRYYAMAVTSYSPMTIIQSWKTPVINIQSGVQAQLSEEALKNLYSHLDQNNNVANLLFGLYTYSDISYSDDKMVGNTSIQIPNAATMPEYSIDFTTKNITDDNASNVYGEKTLSQYLPNGTFAKLLSKPRFTFDATSSTGHSYGALTSYTIGGTTITSPFVNDAWNGENYKIVATDTRGKTAEWLTSMMIIDYFNPYVNNIKVKRNSPTGDTIDVSYTAYYYNGLGMNSNELANAVWKFSYKQNENEQWIQFNGLSGNGTNGVIEYNDVSITHIDYKKPVYYKLEVIDRIGNTMATLQSSIPKGLPVWNAYSDENGNNEMCVNGNLSINDNVSGDRVVGNTMYCDNTIESSMMTTQSEEEVNQHFYSLFMNSKNGLRAIRNNSDSCYYMSQYGSGIAWASADTHGFLYTDWGSNNSYIGGGNEDRITWKDKLLLLNNTYPVGSVYITTTNSAPTFGGTWELIDKEFAPANLGGAGNSTIMTWNSTNTNVSSCSTYVARSGHSISFETKINNKVAFTDSTFDIGTYNLKNIGITRFFIGQNKVAYSDGANDMLYISINDTSGLVQSVDASDHNMTKGNTAYLSFSVNLHPSYMLDEACNKFYWRRVS